MEVRWESPDALSGFGLCVQLFVLGVRVKLSNVALEQLTQHARSRTTYAQASCFTISLLQRPCVPQTEHFLNHPPESDQLIWKIWTHSFREEAKSFRLDTAATASLLVTTLFAKMMFYYFAPKMPCGLSFHLSAGAEPCWLRPAELADTNRRRESFTSSPQQGQKHLQDKINKEAHENLRATHSCAVLKCPILFLAALSSQHKLTVWSLTGSANDYHSLWSNRRLINKSFSVSSCLNGPNGWLIMKNIPAGFLNYLS